VKSGGIAKKGGKKEYWGSLTHKVMEYLDPIVKLQVFWRNKRRKKEEERSWTYKGVKGDSCGAKPRGGKRPGDFLVRCSLNGGSLDRGRRENGKKKGGS